MAQIIRLSSPTSIPLPSSSKGSSLVDTPQPAQTDLALNTDVPLVAINFSGTSPSSNEAPATLSQAPPQTLLNRQSAESQKSVLVGLGFGSDLRIGSGGEIDRNGSGWHERASTEEGEDDEGSDLGLVNVSPITYTANEMASDTEETFARATQHLHQNFGSDALKNQKDVDDARVDRQIEKQRLRAIERESSEEVMVVPDLRKNFNGAGEVVESAAEQRRRRRRMERRESAQNAPSVSPEVGQRGWGIGAMIGRG